MTKAASFAALIQDAVGTHVNLEKGRQGQFEILVGGQTVISRKGGLVAKLVGRPWPSDQDVLAAVRAASESAVG